MTDERTSEDVYGLVETRLTKIETKVDDAMARGNLGGEIEAKQRIREHEQLMIDVPEIRESQDRMEITVDVLADKMIGEKIQDPLRPGEFVINGRGEFMRKPHRQWPKWIGQAIVQSLGVAAALLLFLAATA